MATVTLKFTDDDARSIEHFLRRKYGKDKRTSFSKLCKIAVLTETAEYAKQELDKSGYHKS